jgi:hypothetical protein
MALPIIQNNSTEIVDDLQTSMDINLDIFSFLEKYAEKQVQLLQEILTVIKEQYEFNVDWRRDEEYQSEEARREKPNPPSTPEPSVGDDAGDDAGGFGLLGTLVIGSLAALFTSIKKSIESVITKLKSVFKPIISAFESVITKLKSAFRPVISAFESVITKLKSVFKPIISVFESVITKLKSVFKPIISAFESVFTVFKNILRFFGRFNLFGFIIFGIIDFITGFIDKFKAADSLGEGILEGLWGGITNAIRGIIAIPLDMLKDLSSWLAEKLGFSEVAKVLDSFSFVDLFNKATDWLYNTKTNTWFGGALDDLPEKMKALYTDLKTKLESFVKDYIYDGSGDKIKLFGQELPNMTDIIQFGTEMKTKLTEFVKNNIYDGSGDRIKVFGQELPNMTDISNFGTEIKTKLESFIKDYIYDGSGDKIKLFGQELPNMTDISNFGTAIKTKLESFIKDYIYDPETGSILGINFGDLFKKLDDMLPDMDDIIGQLLVEVPEFFVPDEMKALRAKAIQKNEAEDAAKAAAKAKADLRAKDTTTAAMSFLGNLDETETFKNNTTQQTSTPTTSETTSSIPTTPASKVETKQLSLKEIKKQESKLYYEKYKDMSISQLNKIIQEGSNLTVTERQFVSDLQLLKSKENNTRVYESQSTKFEAKYGIMLSDKTSNTSDSNTTSNTSNSKLIPSTTAPVTGAAVESGSQAVNEMNSQAPIVNVVSDSSSKVNAPVTSTVVNYTPGSSNARNSDNSVRQFSINALSGL